MYGWYRKIEQRFGSCGQIGVRSSHPEASNGSFRWCKGEVWENFVERVTAVLVICHFHEIFEKIEKSDENH